jgi:ClpP class serine protease
MLLTYSGTPDLVLYDLSTILQVMMSPFVPENPEHKKIMDALLENAYDTFKEWVKTNRKDKLKLLTPEIEKEAFSGAVFTSKRALELGLIDAMGDIYGVLEQKYGPEVQLLDVKSRRSILQRLSDDVPRAALNFLETKALENRFGM